MRYLGRLLWLLFTIFIVVTAMIFATSNNDSLTVHMWPFSQSVTAPVWLFILGGSGAGAVFGGVLVWTSFIAIRTRNWRLRSKIAKLEKQATETERKLAEANAQPTNAQNTQTGPFIEGPNAS